MFLTFLLPSFPGIPPFPPVPPPIPPDVPAPEQPELFLKKLQQCCTVFDFMDTLSDLKMKEYKRSTLNELVDYVTVSRGYLTEQAYPEVVKMVSGRGLTENSRNVPVKVSHTLAEASGQENEKRSRWISKV